MTLRRLAIATLVVFFGMLSTRRYAESVDHRRSRHGPGAFPEDPFARWYPASLTKLMTAYVDVPGARCRAGRR